MDAADSVIPQHPITHTHTHPKMKKYSLRKSNMGYKQFLKNALCISVYIIPFSFTISFTSHARYFSSIFTPVSGSFLQYVAEETKNLYYTHSEIKTEFYF